MRRVVYEALVGAPAKMFGGLLALAGFVGSVWPEKVRAIVSDSLPAQALGIALLAAAAVYFFFLWLLKPTDESEGGLTQSTTGPNSSARRRGKSPAVDSDAPSPPAAPLQRKQRSDAGSKRGRKARTQIEPLALQPVRLTETETSAIALGSSTAANPEVSQGSSEEQLAEAHPS